MHHKTSIERILAIENAMDVTAIRYKGLRLWPFIRMQMWRRLIHPHRFAPPGTVGLNYLAQKLSQSFFKPDFYVPYLEHAKRHRDNLTRLSRAGRVDILLFSKSEEYCDKVQGQYVNRYLDPIAELIRTRYTYLKVEPVADGTRQSLPRYEHTHYLDTLEYIRCDAQRSLINAFQKNGNGAYLEEGDRVASLMASIRFDLALTKEYLMVEAERILHYIRYFREILRVLKPRAVFMSGYYDELSMALIAACKPMGIKSVDIQRQFPGAYHGMFTHWNQVPDQGYSLLPDYFWCWSKFDVENMQFQEAGHQNVPRAVIGGNCWLAKSIEDDIGKRDKSLEKYLIDQERYQLRILVSLIDVEDCLPDNLLEAIRQSPANWLWLLKVYPGMEHKVGELQSLFSDLQIQNVNIELASQIPVYQLLKHVDWHVTEWSQIGIEALRFGVPSIIIHPEGKERYSYYFDSGVFAYADRTDNILDYLTNKKPIISHPEHFVVTNPIYALDSLLHIMNHNEAPRKNADVPVAIDSILDKGIKKLRQKVGGPVQYA